MKYQCYTLVFRFLLLPLQKVNHKGEFGKDIVFPDTGIFIIMQKPSNAITAEQTQWTTRLG